MVNVASYIKNLGKSVAYSTVDTAKTIAPSTGGFIDTNQELFKEVFHSVRNYKTAIARTREVMAGSKIYEAADVGFKAVLEDLQTGKFYNKDREDQLAARAGGSMFDMGDMDISSDGFDDSVLDFDEGGNTGKSSGMQITSGDKLISSTVASSSRQSAELISTTMVQTSKMMAENQRMSTNVLYVQNARLMDNLRSSIMNVATGVDNLSRFNTSTMQAHAENSKIFFESSTKMMQEQNAILKEMLEMQRNLYKEHQDAVTKKAKPEAKKRVTYDDIVDANGMPNLKEYFSNVGSNIKGTASDYGLDQLTGGDGNILLSFAANPLKFLPNMLIKSLIGPSVSKAMKNLDTSISGIFGTAISKLNKMAKDDNGSIFSQIFGKIFGIKDSLKSSMDTSKYEKGPTPFDGITRKSIVEVIPGYLRSIESLLSGMGERLYDYDSGKWEQASVLKGRFESIRKSNVKNSFSDMQDTMDKYNSRLTFKSKSERDTYMADIQKILTKIYQDGGYFDAKNKDDDYMDYGVDKTNMALFRKMFNRMPRHKAMQMASSVLGQRNRENKQIEALEESGSSIYNALFDNSGIDKYVTRDKRDPSIITGSTGILGANGLVKQLDNYGHNIFYYFQNVYKELTYMRKYGTAIGGPLSLTGKSDAIIESQFGRRVAEKTPEDIDSVQIKNDAKRTLSQRYRDADQRADQSYLDNEQRRVQRMKNRHREVSTIDYFGDEKENLVRAGARFSEAREDDKWEEFQQEYENMPMIYKLINENAKEVREKNKEYLQSKDKNGDSFLNKLIKAGTLGEKYAVIRDGIDNITASPGAIVTSVLTKADESIYNFFYGEETEKKDENGNPIKGFFNRMVWELKGTFGKVNTWLDETILNPLKEKMDAKTTGELFKNSLKAIGIDVDAIGSNIKNFFVGDSGILRPTIDATKNMFSGAYNMTKQSLKDTYGAAQALVTDKVKGVSNKRKTVSQMSQSEREARKQELISRYGVSDAEIFEEFIKGKKRDTSLSNYSDAAKSKRIGVLDKTFNKFTQLDAKHKTISKLLENYSETQLDRENKDKGAKAKAQLSELKSAIGLDPNVSLTDLIHKTNPTPDELRIIKLLDDPEFKGVANQILVLERASASLLTGKEKLEREQQNIITAKNKIYSKFNTSAKALKNNFDYRGIIQENIRSSYDQIIPDGMQGHEASMDKHQLVLDDLKDFTDLLNPDVIKNLNITDYVTVLDSIAKEFNTDDPVTKLSSLIRLETYNRNKAETDGDKKGFSARINAYQKKLAEYNSAKDNRDEIFGSRLQMLLNSAGAGDTPEAKDIMQSLLGSNMSAKQIGNFSAADLIEFAKSKGSIGLANSLTQKPYEPNLSAKDESDIALTLTQKTEESNSLLSQLDESFNTGSNKLLDTVKEISNKIDGVISAISGMNIGSHAKGARYITKTGLTAISEGEMIIPSEMNPFNPNANNVDKDKEVKNEQKVKSDYSKQLADNIYDSIRENANGDQTIGGGTFAKGVNNLKAGTKEFTNQLFGDQKVLGTAVSDITDKVKSYMPNTIAGGLLGGTIGLATGLASPLLAAIGGSAISIAASSDKMQSWLFGDKIYDKEGNDTGDRSGGVFSKDTQDIFKKYLPDMKTFGISGTLLGMLTPLGPLGGLMVGSAISYAKNNDRMQKMIFGDEEGLLNKDRRKLIADAFPNVAVATVGSLFLGPFGLLGNAALGAGIGLVSTTDEFADFMLGKRDQDGKRTGGLAGALRIHVVDPLAEFASKMKNSLLDFIEKDMVDPLRRAIAPISKDIKEAIGWTFKSVGDFVNKIFEKSLGVPLDTLVKEKIIQPVSKLSSFIFKMATKPAKAVISAPFKAIGAYGDMRRSAQIKKGSADYMTADERLEFRRKRGIKNDRMMSFDELVAGSTRDDLSEIYNALNTVQGGSNFMDKEEGKAIDDLGSTMAKHMSGSQGRDKILKLLHAGKVKEAQKLIFADNGLGFADKEKVSKLAQEKAEALRKIRYQKQNFSGSREDMYSKLQNEYGLKGIGDENIQKYINMIEHEKASRIKTDAMHENGDDQYKAITNAMNNNSRELIDSMKQVITVLEEIKNGTQAMTEEQKEQNEHLEKVTDDSRWAYSKLDVNKMNNRTGILEKSYGENKISEAGQYSLIDNPNRFNQVNKLATQGYQFKDINKLLTLDDKGFTRLVTLANLGYDITDYDKITKMSDSAYANVYRLSKLGYKFTDVSKVMNLDESKVEYLEELHKAGYDKDNLTLDNALKLQHKRRDLLSSPLKFQDIGAEHGEGPVQEDDALKFIGKGNSNQKTKVEMTEDGPVTYIQSSDGSWNPARSKDNQEVLDKKEQRDDTQKGIFANIKNLNTNLTGWFKETLGIGKKKKDEKPWWQKLLELLGAGGLIYGALKILPSINNAITNGTSVIKGAIDGIGTMIKDAWTAGKKALHVSGDNEEDMDTRLEGGAVRALVRSKGNPSKYIPSYFGKTKKAVELGEKGAKYLVENLNPIENLKRTYKNSKGLYDFTTSYNTRQSAADMATKAAGHAGGFIDKAMNVAHSVVSNIPGMKNFADKALLNGTIAKQYAGITASNTLDGIQSFLSGLADKPSNVASKAGGVVEDVASHSPMITTILAKAKGCFEGLLPKIKGFISSKAEGEGVVKVFERVMEELAARLPKCITKISASVATAGLFNVIDGFGGFISGYQDTNSIYGITHGATAGMKLCAGLTRALNNLLAFGVIPEKWIMNVVIDYLGPAVGFDMSSIQKLRGDSEAEVAEYNKNNNTDLSVEQYNKEILDDKTIFERFSDSAVGKFIKEGAGAGASAIWQGITKAGTWAYDSIAGLVGGLVDLSGYTMDVVKSGVSWALNSGEDYKSSQAAQDVTIKDDDPLAGFKKVIFYGLRTALFPVNATLAIGKELYDMLKPLGNGILEAGKGILDDTGADFDMAMSGKIGDMWSTWAPINDESGFAIPSIRNAVGIIPKIIMTPIAMINGAMNSMIDNSSSTIESLKTLGSSISDGASSMAKAAILGDYESVFSTPEPNENAPGFVNDLAKVANIATKVMLAPLAIPLSPIGIVVRSVSTLLDGMTNSGVITDAERQRIDNGEVPLSELFDTSSAYWSTAQTTADGNPMSMLGWLGSKMYKMMMAPVVMFKSMFSSVGESIDGAKSWVGTKFQWLKNYFSTDPTSGKGKYGMGKKAKYGMGEADDVPPCSDMDDGSKDTDSPVTKPTFYSQLDPKNAMRFNSGSDTISQTMRDSGCGPVTASNLISNLTGQQLDPKAAANYALNNGYKEQNGGTTPDYFQDVMNKYGIASRFTNGKDDMLQNLKNGNPVVMMGQDSKISSQTPYGTSPHYVLGTGLDKDGKVIVQDPETNTPNLKYNASDVLNKTSIGVAADQVPDYNRIDYQNDSLDVIRAKQAVGGYGRKAKYGRGKGTNVHYAIAQAKYGRGRMPMYGMGGADNGQIAWDYLIKQGFSSYAVAGILGNLMRESSIEPRKIEGGAIGDLVIDDKTGYGIAQWTSAGRQKGLYDWAMSHGGDPGDLLTQLSFLVDEMGEDLITSMNRAGNVEQATILFCNEFERPGVVAMDERIAFANDFFANQGKGVAIAGTRTGSSTKGGNTKRNKGIMGMFDDMNSQMNDKLKGVMNPLTQAMTTGANKYYGPAKQILFGDDTNTGSSSSTGNKGASQGKLSVNNAPNNAEDWLLTNIPGSEVSAQYNEQRGNRFHHGVDIAADEGVRIPSPITGKVSDVGVDPGGYGNYTEVTDKTGRTHLFGHMQNLVKNVGDDVNKGDDLGPLGNTGHSTGPHTHYEVRENNEPVDPSGITLNGLGKHGLGKSKAAQLPSISTSGTRKGIGGDDYLDYTELLKTIIQILLTIADNTGKLGQVDKMLSDKTGEPTTQTPAQDKTSKANTMNSIISKLGKIAGSKNGFGDLFANKGTDSIIGVMRSIASE